MRVALFEPDIPQNTGNILRLGACLGIPIDIIGPTGFIFDDKKFKRSSMDYINHVELRKYLDWEAFYFWVKKNNKRIILLTTKSNKKYYEHKYKNDDILLFGRESAGVPDEIHKIVDKKIKIPMKQGMRSINVSSSVSLVVGEAARQLKLF